MSSTLPLPPRPHPDATIFVLSGAGLSAASGVPTFRGEGGWWRGHKATELATPEAFSRDPDLVLRFYAMRRDVVRGVEPNDGHRALVRLQQAWNAQPGRGRLVLVTQNVDGLLQQAARELGMDSEVIEMHGTLWTVRCSADPQHPSLPVGDDLPLRSECTTCRGLMRPHITWFGEMPMDMARIDTELVDSAVFISVGTSGVVYPAAGFVSAARQLGARCYEVNPVPSGGDFDQVLTGGAEEVLPALLESWCG